LGHEIFKMRQKGRWKGWKIRVTLWGGARRGRREKREWVQSKKAF